MKDELRQLTLFSDFSDEQLEYLIAHCSVESYQAGQLIHEGKPSRFFWILLSGEWHNTRYVIGSKEPLEVVRNKPGTWFGGIEFVDVVAPMSATATEDSRFLAIPTRTMYRMIRLGFPIAHHLMSGVKAGMTWFLEHAEKYSR